MHMTPESDRSNSEEFQRAQDEIAVRLRRRGVSLTGRETGDELADALDAVERFESAVENSGGDLMVDEPVGTGSPIAPDDEAFVLPRRQGNEPMARFIERIEVAISRAKARGRQD
jgi:hypothetical protein